MHNFTVLILFICAKFFSSSKCCCCYFFCFSFIPLALCAMCRSQIIARWSKTICISLLILFTVYHFKCLCLEYRKKNIEKEWEWKEWNIEKSLAKMAHDHEMSNVKEKCERTDRIDMLKPNSNNAKWCSFLRFTSLHLYSSFNNPWWERKRMKETKKKHQPKSNGKMYNDEIASNYANRPQKSETRREWKKNE